MGGHVVSRMRPAIPAVDLLEKDWAKQVRDLAETLGYRRYHTFNSRLSDTGFPDWVLVHPQRQRVVFLELKREKGKLTGQQVGWVRDLYVAGAEVYVARPRHLQALAAVLSGRPDTEAFHVARGQLLAELDPVLEAA